MTTRSCRFFRTCSATFCWSRPGAVPLTTEELINEHCGKPGRGHHRECAPGAVARARSADALRRIASLSASATLDETLNIRPRNWQTSSTRMQARSSFMVDSVALRLSRSPCLAHRRILAVLLFKYLWMTPTTATQFPAARNLSFP